MLYATDDWCMPLSFNRNPRAIRIHESIGTNLGSLARQIGVCHAITLRRMAIIRDTLPSSMGMNPINFIVFKINKLYTNLY